MTKSDISRRNVLRTLVAFIVLKIAPDMEFKDLKLSWSNNVKNAGLSFTQDNGELINGFRKYNLGLIPNFRRVKKTAQKTKLKQLGAS